MFNHPSIYSPNSRDEGSSTFRLFCVGPARLRDARSNVPTKYAPTVRSDLQYVPVRDAHPDLPLHYQAVRWLFSFVGASCRRVKQAVYHRHKLR